MKNIIKNKAIIMYHLDNTITVLNKVMIWIWMIRIIHTRKEHELSEKRRKQNVMDDLTQEQKMLEEKTAENKKVIDANRQKAKEKKSMNQNKTKHKSREITRSTRNASTRVR